MPIISQATKSTGVIGATVMSVERHRSCMFASHGARKRIPGQGVLGEHLASVALAQVPGPSVLGRLQRGRVFCEQGEHGVLALLQRHKNAAETTPMPFNASISAGKNTYTYDAHTYHTKVPPQGISELLSHYLPKGGLVLDPFSGSGMTGVAASVLGSDCILNELSPAACFISDRFTRTVSPVEFEAAVSAVVESLGALRRELYSTQCRECGKTVELLYTVWSYRVVCNHCNQEFLLWDHCRRYGRTVREHKILGEFPCPRCGQTVRKSGLKRTTAEPVLVGYKCCGSRQQERTHEPNAYDREKIQRLDSNPHLQEGFYPTNPLPNGVNLRQPAKHGLDRIDKFYTPRNLAALSHLWRAIHMIESPQMAGHLAFVFTSL